MIMTKTNKHTCKMPLTLDEVALLAWAINTHPAVCKDTKFADQFVGKDTKFADPSIFKAVLSDLSKKVTKALHDAPDTPKRQEGSIDDLLGTRYLRSQSNCQECAVYDKFLAWAMRDASTEEHSVKFMIDSWLKHYTTCHPADSEDAVP